MAGMEDANAGGTNAGGVNVASMNPDQAFALAASAPGKASYEPGGSSNAFHPTCPDQTVDLGMWDEAPTTSPKVSASSCSE